MLIRFRRETKIIFAILGIIVIAAAVYIAVNYNRLKNSSPISPTLGVRTQMLFGRK